MPHFFPPAATIRRIVTPIIKDAAAQLGAVVMFARGGSAYDESTGLTSGAKVAASAHATRKPGLPESAINLGQLVDPIWLNVPADELNGFVPQSNSDTFTFAGVGYAVKLVDPLGSDGIPISFSVVGSR